VKLLPVDNAVH